MNLFLLTGRHRHFFHLYLAAISQLSSTVLGQLNDGMSTAIADVQSLATTSVKGQLNDGMSTAIADVQILTITSAKVPLATTNNAVDASLNLADLHTAISETHELSSMVSSPGDFDITSSLPMANSSASSTDSPKNINYTIGMLHDISVVPSIGHTMRAAAQIAVDMVNRNPNILPGAKLILKEADAQGSEREAGIQTLELIKDDTLVAILGPTFSLPALTAQYVAQLFRIPQISPTATLSLLSDKTEYPTFMRTNGGGYTQIISWFIHEMGWRNIVVLIHSTHFSISESAQFLLHSAKMKIVISRQFYFRDSSIRKKLKLIKSSKSRIVVLFSDAVHAAYVLKIARSLGMLDVGWQWIGNDGWMQELVNNSTEVSLHQGLLGLTPRVSANRPLLDDWTNALSTVVGDNITFFRPYPGFTGSEEEINWVVEATYSAVLVIAQALCGNLRKGIDAHNKTEMFDSMKRVKLVDSDGQVFAEFDKSTGDRLIEYSIVNGRANGLFEEIGYFTRKSGFVLNTKPLFGGGSSKQPLDMEECGANQIVDGGTCSSCPIGYCPQGPLATRCSLCVKIKRPYAENFNTALNAISVVCLLICLLIALWGFLRHSALQAASSMPYLLYLATLGAALVFTFPIALTRPASDVLCIYRIWSRYLGMQIILSVVTVAAWPSSTFFRRSTKRSSSSNLRRLPTLTSKTAFTYCLVYITVIVMWLIFWSALNSPHPVSNSYKENGRTYIYTDCHEGASWHWTVCVVLLVLWICATILSYNGRAFHGNFYNAFYIFIASGLASLVWIVAMTAQIVLDQRMEGTSETWGGLVEGTQFTITALIVILFLWTPQAWQIEQSAWTKKEGSGGSKWDQSDLNLDEDGFIEEESPAEAINTLEEENGYLHDQLARLQSQLLGLGNRHLLSCGPSKRTSITLPHTYQVNQVNSIRPKMSGAEVRDDVIASSI